MSLSDYSSRDEFDGPFSHYVDGAHDDNFAYACDVLEGTADYPPEVFNSPDIQRIRHEAMRVIDHWQEIMLANVGKSFPLFDPSRSFNDPTTACCGRDAADCDCGEEDS